MIIAGYPGIGKSSLAKTFEHRIIDLEPNLFSFAGERIKNWYIIYCKLARYLSDQGFIVFVSSHREVRNYLNNLKEFYAVIHPDVMLKYEWVKKLCKRYDENRTDKNLRAINYVIEHFEESVNDIVTNDKYSIPITSLDYKLEDLVNKAVEYEKSYIEELNKNGFQGSGETETF